MKNKKNGFTLAEVLIAVAVIGVIVAISIPLFTGRAEAAKETVCKNARENMRQGTVVAALTEHKDWLEYTPEDTESIITYLLTHHYMEEVFSCQAGGDIYVVKVAADGVRFRCTFHDDGVVPGKEDEDSPLLIAGNLKESVEFLMQSNPDLQTNDQVIREYLKKTESSIYIREADLSTLFTDETIQKLAELLIKNFGFINEKETIIASIGKQLETQRYLVPYVAAKVVDNSKIITYFTSEAGVNALRQGPATHLPSNLIYYGGKWYFYANINGSKTGVNPAYLMPVFTDCTDVITVIKSDSRFIPLDSLK